MDEATAKLMRQWHRAAFRAAQLVAHRYGANEQERADLSADCLSALWTCINRGWIAANTPTNLVLTIICRAIVDHAAGGIKTWRLNVYRSKDTGTDKRRYMSRPLTTFSAHWGEGATEEAEELPARPETDDGSESRELVAALARAANLTASEQDALFARATGTGQILWADRCEERKARTKLRAVEAEALSILTGTQTE